MDYIHYCTNMGIKNKKLKTFKGDDKENMNISVFLPAPCWFSEFKAVALGSGSKSRTHRGVGLQSIFPTRKLEQLQREEPRPVSPLTPCVLS